MKEPIVTIANAEYADALDVELTRWRIFTAADPNTPADVLEIIQQRGKIKPEAARRAIQYFGDVIRGTDDWWMLYVAGKYGEVEDKATAIRLFDTAIGNNWGTTRIKQSVTDARAPSKTSPAKPKPAQPCERCERVRELERQWTYLRPPDTELFGDDLKRLTICHNQLCAALNGEATP